MQDLPKITSLSVRMDAFSAAESLTICNLPELTLFETGENTFYSTQTISLAGILSTVLITSSSKACNN